MIYYCKNNKLYEKKYIFEKITPCLPQDIIGCLIFDGLIDKNSDINRIKDIYNNNTDKYNNLEEFFLKFKISNNKFAIIYTFSNLFEQLNDIDNSILVENESFIKSENYFKTITLKDFYNNNSVDALILKMQANSIEDIIYLKIFIYSYEEYYKKNIYLNEKFEKKKFIFTAHISRQFYSSKDRKNKKKK